MATTNTRNTKGTTNIGEIIRVIKAYENYTTEQCRDLIAEAKHEGPEARAKALECCGDMISQFGLFKSLLEELVQERFAKQAEGTEFDELASKMPKELQALRDDYNKQQEEQRRKKLGRI